LYFPAKKIAGENPVIIGWSGSNTTAKHFELAKPFLRELKKQFCDRIAFVLISNTDPHITDLVVQRVQWTPFDEVMQLNKIDIGIMPLPDDDWSRGKCGFKALQYMALEVPPVVSPVGVNMEIVQHGINGFLASNEPEWIHYLSILIESPELRIKIGEEARKTVESNFSLQTNASVLISVLRNLTG
jgi:glycosyltransferase involved in cell wall biosynthesis